MAQQRWNIAEEKNVQLFRNYPIFFNRGHTKKFHHQNKFEALQKMVLKMEEFLVDPVDRQAYFPDGINRKFYYFENNHVYYFL